MWPSHPTLLQVSSAGIALGDKTAIYMAHNVQPGSDACPKNGALQAGQGMAGSGGAAAPAGSAPPAKRECPGKPKAREAVR